MIGSKAQAKMGGSKEAAKMGAAGGGGGLGANMAGALSGLAGLMTPEDPMPAPPQLSNPLALAGQGQAPVNGTQWRQIQPRQPMPQPMGMFNRLNPMMGRTLG